MPRHFRERTFGRHEFEEPRFRTRVRTPSPSLNRHREERPRGRFENDHLRSRSPRGDKRRPRDSPGRMAQLDYVSPPRELISLRGRDRDVRVRRESPSRSFVMPESKYVDDHYSDHPPVQWTDPSQDIPASVYSSTPYLNQTSDNVLDSPAIPEFNPESSKLNSKEWLDLLEMTGNERGWKQDEKLYIMTSRLAGFARQWYLTSGINIKSWSDLKDGFLKAFPTELEYHALLSKMLTRVKEESETLSQYFLHKVALLNACEIQGVKAVSCIIAGLSNAKMQHQAKMQKCEDPDQLYLYLRSLSNEEPNKTRSGKNDDVSKKDREEKSKGKKGCFFCGNPGHIVINCRNIKKHKCSVCNIVGHECKPLTLRGGNMEHNQVMEGSLSHTEVQQKNFTEVFLNGVVLKAYIDFESEAITIKEEAALQARLKIKKQFQVVRGFSGASISTIGYIDTSLYIDRAIANVRIAVVPDTCQCIPIVVGRAFTQQPQVIILKDGGRIRFYQRSENGETNFDF